jgi:hypothetical protein
VLTEIISSRLVPSAFRAGVGAVAAVAFNGAAGAAVVAAAAASY